MKITITDNIQIQLLKLTKKKFSKKYIKINILPIVEYIIYSDKNKFLIAGSQGIGKSTLIKVIKNNIEKFYKKKILTLSLDDYYLVKNERLKLSKKIHPLFKTRGVPGTHDIKKLKTHINSFDKFNYPINIPIFDKLSDDRSSKFRKEKIKKDILLLEGWCCGCPPLEKKFLNNSMNQLEMEEDKEFVWRNHFNKHLNNEYKELFNMFDKIIFLKAPSFKFILNWRLKQEKMMANNKKKPLKMNKEEVLYFISHYEKVTKWMIKKLPSLANLVVNIDENQKIKKIEFN